MSTTVYFPADKTPAEWLEMSRSSRQSEQDSWERSDTDGFLSQWASGCMARLYDLCARLAEHGGKAEVKWPFVQVDANTWEAVEAWKWVESRFGSSVLLNPGVDGKFWNPSEARKGATRQRNDERKGVRWGTVRTEMVVMMGGGLTPSPFSEPKRGAAIEIVTALDDSYENDYEY